MNQKLHMKNYTQICIKHLFQEWDIFAVYLFTSEYSLFTCTISFASDNHMWAELPMNIPIVEHEKTDAYGPRVTWDLC